MQDFELEMKDLLVTIDAKRSRNRRVSVSYRNQLFASSYLKKSPGFEHKKLRKSSPVNVAITKAVDGDFERPPLGIERVFHNLSAIRAKLPAEEKKERNLRKYRKRKKKGIL